jgi:hypothetical protein
LNWHEIPQWGFGLVLVESEFWVMEGEQKATLSWPFKWVVAQSLSWLIVGQSLIF